MTPQESTQVELLVGKKELDRLIREIEWPEEYRDKIRINEAIYQYVDRESFEFHLTFSGKYKGEGRLRFSILNQEDKMIEAVDLKLDVKQKLLRLGATLFEKMICKHVTDIIQHQVNEWKQKIEAATRTISLPAHIPFLLQWHQPDRQMDLTMFLACDPDGLRLTLQAERLVFRLIPG